ncbi:Ankyrin repeat domain containing protein, partial [Asbolus verrucosus]
MGADINKTFSDGHTPLTHAVIRGNTQLLEDLLNRGADPNKEDESGKTPLSMAAIAGNLEMVKILLDRGAGATIQTAFLDAIQSKNLDIVKYMKEKGAKMNWANKHGLTPLMKALHVEGADDIVKYLIENGTALDEQLEFSLVMEKVKQKNLEFLKILVDLGADLNQVDQYSYTPLTKATELEHFEIVKYLLRNGTDVNYPKIDGKTALAIAAANGFYQIATFLVRWRADVNLARAE